MREGWVGEDYFILFEEHEIAKVTREYDIEKTLKSFQIVGLKGWDDFVLRNEAGEHFTVPTLPLDEKYMARTTWPPIGVESLVADNRFAGKIKWYTNPLIFGGSPTALENIGWITFDQHIQAVKWWNEMYRNAVQK